jgi:hypothetical protein
VRNSVSMAMAALTLAPAAHAEPIRTAAAGSAERAQIMDAIRPYVEKDFGAPVEFVVRGLNISGGYAVALLDAQRPGGRRIDIERTPLAAERYRSGMVDHMVDCCHAEAILRRVKGRWRVVEAVAGSTDVWYTDWCRRLPAGMCDTGRGSR